LRRRRAASRDSIRNKAGQLERPTVPRNGRLRRIEVDAATRVSDRQPVMIELA
jgi:hypothetical protein